MAGFASPVLSTWTFLTTLNVNRFAPPTDDAPATADTASTATTITVGADRRWRGHSG